MSQTNKILVTEFQQRLALQLKGESNELASVFSDDVIWHLPPSAEDNGSSATHSGLDAVMAMFSGDVSHFYQPDTISFQYHSLIAENDLVHCRFSMNALTANGDNYANEYQALYRITQGKIAEVWESFDTVRLFSLFNT